jgi:hypothetical protein
MVVAVIAIRMMEMTVHQVIDVVAMRNRFMTAVRAMLVVGAVRVTLVSVGAGGRIRGTNLKRVFIDVTVMKRVQMSVMQVIGVIVVDDRCVAAVRAVLVGVVRVDLVLIRHRYFSFEERQQARIVRGRSCEWLFGSMGQTIEDKVQYMLIGQKVENVFSFAPTSDNIVGTKNPKTLRDDRDGLAFQLRQLRDTRLSLSQPCYQPNPRRFTESTKDPGCALDGRLVDRNVETLRVVTFSGTGGLRFDPHKPNIYTLAHICKCVLATLFQ